MRQRILMMNALAGLMALVLAGTAWAQVSTREETMAGKKVLVLENDFAKLVVLPDPGGTVLEFVDKKTGTDFVAGKDRVLAGRLGFGWKDYYQLEATEAMGKWVFAQPYQAEFKEGPGYRAIYVTTEAEGQKFEREMRLADNSAELTTKIKITNISKEPRRLQVRWHTYSTLDDKNAEHSCILAPGFNGQVRKAFIGSGWDHQFITSDPFWMAVNYKDRTGIWMTFNKEESGVHITWTDYNSSRPGPGRGMYVAEPHPQATIAKPGESVTYDSTFYPFSASDNGQTMPMGMLKDPELQGRARAFLNNSLPNLAAIGPFTMTPGDPPAGVTGPQVENRFDFSHRRRDRFALRAWGMMDAMMAVSSLQAKPIRTRYYARLFDGQKGPVKVSFRLSMIDPAGLVARAQTKEYTLMPGAGKEVDFQDSVSMVGLKDGWYQFVLEGYVEGEKEPIHTYIEKRKLIGEANPTAFAAQEARENAPPVVRAFVDALYKKTWPVQTPGQVAVPIGVEEGGGVARSGWPVRCGVPLAQGMAKREDAFEIVSPDGKSRPAQTEVMATWMDGSIKWLLVDFEASVPADGHVFYTLRHAGKKAQGELLAYEGPNGPAIRGLNFASQGFDARKVLGLFGPDDLWWQDHLGKRFMFQLKGDGAGVVIEENGPDRAVLKATGWYLNEKGQHASMGELRLEAYRGQKFVRLYHTVTFTGDPWRQELASYGARFSMPGQRFESASVSEDGKVLTGGLLTVFQRSSDGLTRKIDGKDGIGVRCNGAVVMKRASGPAIGIQHVDFWKMAPKKIVADVKSGEVEFSYWPADAGAMSFLPREDGWIPCSSDSRAVAVGTGRTQEFVIDLDCKLEPGRFDAVYNEPVVALAPPKYLAQTKAMMHLSPFDPQRYPALEKVVSDTIDFYIQQQELFGWYGQWTYGGMPNFWQPKEFRWWDFGRYAWILNEQDIVETPWLCFMRSGDRKYLKLATSNTRHLMEVATIRWNPVWPNYVGFSRRHHECIWLGDGDSGHSMLDPYLDYYYMTGHRPAKDAAERLAGGMMTISSGAWRYISNPIAGLSRMYLDTQNPVYKEHADRIWNTQCKPDKNNWWQGDHADRMVMWYSQINPECMELCLKWVLDPNYKDRFKNGADLLTMLYLQTGDARYAQAAAKLVPQERQMTITQAVLANLRAACYAGESVAKEGGK
jgi:hypothetical protein